VRRVLRGARRVWSTLACAMLAGAAWAQIKVDNVRFGWDGDATVGSWMPVTLDVTGGPLGFSGMVTIEFPLDATQRGSVRAAIAATPGLSTSVMIPVCVSGSEGSIEVRITGPDGLVFRRSYQRQGPDPLILDQQPDNTAMLAIGKSSVVEMPRSMSAKEQELRTVLLQRWRGQEERIDSDAERTLRFNMIRVAQREPNQAPADSLLYDGLRCVVLGEIDGSAGGSLGSGQEQAIKRWVRAGGWLVVQARAGDDWRRWVEDEAGDVPVELAPAAEHALLDETGAELHRLRDAAVESSEAGQSRVAFDLVDRVTARRAALTALGASRGWKLRWLVDAGGGMIAEGPVGLGMVTIVTVEPRSVSRVLSRDVTRAAWRSVLERALKRMETPLPGASSEVMEDPVSRAAQQMPTRPPVGLGYLLCLVGGALALTLLVGPVDGLVLKRLRLQHRAWLTGLGWIGLASAAGYLVPLLFRSGQSEVSQVSVLDGIAAEDGRLEQAERSVVYGMLAQRPTSARIAGEGEPVRPGGVYVRRAWELGGWNRFMGFGEEMSVFPPLDIEYARDARGASAVDERVARLTPVPLPQWSFRVLTTDGPARTPELRVKAKREGPEHLTLEVQGLGQPAAITEAWVEDHGALRPVTIGGAAGEGWKLVAGRKASSGDAKALRKLGGDESLLRLAGPDVRSEALTWMQRGGYVTLVMKVTGLPLAGEVEFGDGASKAWHQSLMRIAVPVRTEGGT